LRGTTLKQLFDADANRSTRLVAEGAIGGHRRVDGATIRAGLCRSDWCADEGYWAPAVASEPRRRRPG
jgi:hypothetical protein